MPRESNGKFTRAAVLLTCAALLVAAVTFTVRAEMTARSAAEKSVDHEARLRTVERSLGEMAADIRVIRELVERQLQERRRER
jgi:hypothetical protein